MSQRAAWQLERYGFTHVHDFVPGKAYWLASGRPTVREQPVDRVIDHLTTDIATIEARATAAQATETQVSDESCIVVIDTNDVVQGTLSADSLHDADPDMIVADIMRLGPTTIRPDELTDAVRERMANRNVQSLLVTTPTGELLGAFDIG